MDFVFVGLSFFFLFQVADDQVAKVFLGLQICTLQQLPQLPHLDLSINALEPLADSCQSLRLRPVHALFQLHTGRGAQFERPVQSPAIGFTAPPAPPNPPNSPTINPPPS